MQNISVVVLAAGKGTRMNHDTLPKVLVPYNDKPMLGHVLDSIVPLSPNKTVLIVGYKEDMVRDYVDKRYKVAANVEFATQSQQLGTGHAVMQAKDNLQDFEGNTLILCGDVPRLTHATLEKLATEHSDTGADLTVLTAIAENPTGYGRIIKDDHNSFIKIVEQKDASEEEKKVKEINSGTYLVDNQMLFNALDSIGNQNAQGEYYLTDIVGIMKQDNRKINTYIVDDFDEIVGINSMEDLEAVEREDFDS
jgi:bifunctional UDP-N-acetylglucosamine pyrophosphorylase/glucosamine-1-phosphate N-acetyltransferase